MIKRHMLVAFVGAAVISVASAASATTGSAPIESGEYWAENDVFVLFAKVIDVEDARGGVIMTLRPIATLAGRFDPAFAPDIRVGASAGFLFGVVLPKGPAKGAYIVALIKHGIAPRDEPEMQSHPEYYSVPNASISCFPPTNASQLGPAHAPALFEVAGFDDPKVTETIENLRKLRGKQREEAEQKAAAEKKSPPEKQSSK